MARSLLQGIGLVLEGTLKRFRRNEGIKEIRYERRYNPPATWAWIH